MVQWAVKRSLVNFWPEGRVSFLCLNDLPASAWVSSHSEVVCLCLPFDGMMTCPGRFSAFRPMTPPALTPPTLGKQVR